jgi:hypothetical protein
MIHIARGQDRSTAHTHGTVAQARDCEADHEEARQEVWAESAWLRAAEYDPQLAEETQREIAYENWLLGV